MNLEKPADRIFQLDFPETKTSNHLEKGSIYNQFKHHIIRESKAYAFTLGSSGGKNILRTGKSMYGIIMHKLKTTMPYTFYRFNRITHNRFAKIPTIFLYK